LVAAAAISRRGAPGPALAAQLLIYPALDATMSQPSYSELADAPFLTSAAMQWFYELYAPDADDRDPRLSPLHADDLTGLPPTLVITASDDVLRDEGEAFAHSLAAAGVDSSATRSLGATHGFFGWTHAAAPSRAAMLQATAWLRARLG
jgi:acetyl esterase